MIGQPFPQMVAEEQRRDILLLLAGSPPKFSLTNRLLYRALATSKMFPPSQDQIDGHVAWLAQMLLVQTEDMSGGIVMVTVKQRGKDAALGIAAVPGVAAPEPEL